MLLRLVVCDMENMRTRYEIIPNIFGMVGRLCGNGEMLLIAHALHFAVCFVQR